MILKQVLYKIVCTVDTSGSVLKGLGTQVQSPTDKISPNSKIKQADNKAEV